LVRGLRRESVAARLDYAKRLLVDTSIKLGKAPTEVEIQCDDLRLPPGPWAPFWSVLSHVLNNAVDHGLETDAERLAAGKPVPGRIWLSTRVEAGDVVVEVRDDGRGIDWDRVRTLAVERGLPSQSQADLERALLSDGFSLKNQVTEISGRGVGLAAVRTVVTAMSGEIELESKLHEGATWRFRFPLSTLDDSGSQATSGQAAAIEPQGIAPNISSRAAV
jgi:two-component system chemotaxis sensor kinase CheA